MSRNSGARLARGTSRRRFLTGLGLGAGVTLFAPLTRRLVGRAVGDDEPPKRLILMSPYMMEPANYRPIQPDDPSETVPPTVPDAWPEVFGPLAAYMSRAALIDASRLDIGGHQHRAGTCALSCVRPTNGRPESLGPAGAATIDQHVATTLSATTPYKSILWGITGDAIAGERETSSGVFAAGREQNLSHFTHARAMMDAVFPDTDGSSGMASGTSPFGPVRDRLLGEIARLRQRLAPEERIALEGYEEAIVEFDRRQAARAAISCTSPPEPPSGKEPQDHLESMMDQTMLALSCGLTNVVGITVGTSNNHNKHDPIYREMHERTSRPGGEASLFGHGGWDPANRPYALEAARHQHEVHFRNLARVLDRLAETPESDGSTVFDHTAVLYVPGNGDTGGGHHAAGNGKSQFPALLIAGDRTGFVTGGRYMSGSRHAWRGDRWRLANVYRTLCVGLGVDPAGFGDDSAVSLFEEVLS